MRAWPRQHQHALAAFIFLLLVAAAVYLFAVRPRAQEVDALSMESADLRKKLEDIGWPLDEGRLNGILEDAKRRLEGTASTTGLQARSEEVLARATAMLDTRVAKMVDSKADFVTSANQLDYAAEFNDLESRLNRYGIFLAEKTFGLSVDTSSDETYRQLLQLWTVDALVNLLTRQKLVIVRDPTVPIPTPMGVDLQASKLAALPVRTYVINAEDKAPYILEFPIRVTFTGDIENVVSFIQSLQQDDAFFSLNRIEMKAASPLRTRPDKDGKFRVEKVEATVECASFFRPSDSAPKAKVDTTIRIPGGV